MGDRVPQHVQNIVIRDYCHKHDLSYFLSKAEYCIEESFSILNNFLNELSELDGVVVYSLFQLPNNSEDFRKIFDEVIGKNKIMYFALEDLSLSCKEDIKYLENMFNIRKYLDKCPTNINV